MNLKATFAAAALTLFAGSFALAQTPVKPVVPAKPAVTAPAATAPAAKPVVTDDAKKAKSKACSAKADAQSLHGKARKKFRDECKKAA